MLNIILTPWRSLTQAAPSFITRIEWRAIALISLLICSWFLGAQLISSLYPDSQVSSSNVATQYLSYAVRNGSVFMAMWMVYALRETGDTPLFEYIKSNARENKTAWLAILVKFAVALISFSGFLYSYSMIKTRIPVISPYNWDQSFFELDRLLFFGRDPWTLFEWIYGVPSLLKAMDFIYDIWAVMLVGIWALCFITAKHGVATRYRFPLALLITWFFGGNLIAILLSSAGPCYYGLITGLSDPYAAQMAILASINEVTPLAAFNYQGILQSTYESQSFGLGGISAMPSMHCATSFLFVLMAWKRPILRYVALTFFTLIFITSFMLAWHYAVDGLLAIPIAIGAWWLAKRILSVTTKADA